MPRPTEEVYTQVVPSIVKVSNAPELFAQQLSQASKGHKYHGWTLWLLKRDNREHYLLFNESRQKQGEGLEVLISKMHEFAEAESYFSEGKHTDEYKWREREWKALAKPPAED